MTEPQHILLAHGGGGQLTAELIRDVILPALGGQDPAALTDSAELDLPAGRVCFTTDSYVVEPLEFPGGDIGKLAVCGTVNDLAVAGAEPRALSLALVLTEGLAIALLKRVLASAAEAARSAGVTIVTGDTKVVERRGVPGMIVNTAGVGVMPAGAALGFGRVETGDAVILSGPLGQHALAVMCCRKGLTVAADLQSDCASLNELTAALVEAVGGDLHWMRDPTRGGLAGVLADLSAATGRNVEIRQTAIPTDPAAVAAAEMLGLDLLSAANEGKLVAVVAAGAAEKSAEVLRCFDLASDAAVIGAVGEPSDLPLVEMLTRAGGRRVVQMPYGEDLPRIC
jgi:hydrogenase expression/formation protein HypE